jgi:hypothetical protein
MAYGDAYWRSRGTSRIHRMAVEVKYGIDRDRDTWVGATEQEYIDLGDEVGWQEYYTLLQIKEKMEELYFEDDEGGRIEAARIYDEVREEYWFVPYWFWGYHGVYD